MDTRGSQLDELIVQLLHERHHIVSGAAKTTARQLLDTFAEAGFCVIRTDMDTQMRAVDAMANQIHQRRWGSDKRLHMVPDDFVAASQAIACALAVLRGDSQ